MTGKPWGALAAVALAAVAGCGTQASSQDAAVTPRSTAAPAPAGMQRAWLRGVGVDVPQAWKRNALRCSVPVADTVVVEYSGSANEGCLLTRPPTRLSVVWVGTFSRPLHDNVMLGDVTIRSDAQVDGFEDSTIDGVHVKETTQSTEDGRTARLVLFPDRDTYVSVASPDPAVLRAVVQSLQVSDTDPGTGCAVHTDAYDEGKPPDQGGGNALLPGDPTSVDACVYVGGWLEQNAHVTGEKLTTLVDAVRAAPVTTDQRAPDDTNCESVAADLTPADNPPMLLRFDGTDGHWLVVAKTSWCTRWQSTISSGSTTRRIDRRLLLALPPLWTETPDPDSMDIG